MTDHIDLYHVVRVAVTTTDTGLLDSLESELPATDADEVGPEYDGPQRVTDDPSLDDGQERLTARVTFADTANTPAADHSSALFTALSNLSLAGEYDIDCYRSPVGGVTVDQVQAYYEAHPDEQPVDDDGNPTIPSAFDPSNHRIDRLTSG